MPQLVDRQPQCIRDDLHRIERRVRLPTLQAAQISLIEAAALPKFDLAQTGLDTQLSNAPAKALSEGFLHPRNYPRYALNHINTNSYKLGVVFPPRVAASRRERIYNPLTALRRSSKSPNEPKRKAGCLMIERELEKASGHDVSRCPHCGDDHWKSAKMVVLEGTTMASGQLEGSVRDKGTFGGGARSFLLSDRWFSRDHALGAEIKLVSITALAESVKQLMVAQAESMSIPSRPDPAKTTSMWDKVRPSDPGTRPVPPEPLLQPPAPERKSWQAHFGQKFARSFVLSVITSFIIALVGLTWSWWEPGDVVYAAYALGILVTLGAACALLTAFHANDEEEEEYQRAFVRFEQRVAVAHTRFEERLKQFDQKSAQYQLDLKKAAEQAAYEQEEKVRYTREVAAFEAATSEIALHREMLWERARVCSRCSVTYLAS
jgi:hypothetical protein